MADFPDEGSLIKEIPKDKIDEYKQHAEGRMRIKLLGAQEALNQGVSRVVLGDARRENPVRDALAGIGTVIS